MKHLRRFNEGLKDELQDFCEMYLAYLIDDGFWIDIYDENVTYYFPEVVDQDLIYRVIVLEKEEPEDSEGWEFSNGRGFSWDEIKDQYIPFLKMLSKSYQLTKITYYKKWVDVKVCYRQQVWNNLIKTYTFSDFISGKFDDELSTMDIIGINIGVKL